jgi:hypothetical protein
MTIVRLCPMCGSPLILSERDEEVCEMCDRWEPVDDAPKPDDGRPSQARPSEGD